MSRMVYLYNITVPTLFVAFWLVPIAYKGITRQSIATIPEQMNRIHAVTGMFHYAPDEWTVFRVEVSAKGSDEWSSFPDEHYFSQAPLGNRSQLQAILSSIYRLESKEPLQNLAIWISEQYQVPVSVRIVENLANPTGFPTDTVLSQHSWSDSSQRIIYIHQD